MPRLPMLAGTRVTVVNARDDAVVLAPPAPHEAVADVASAVRDALRFPLSGPPLDALAVRGGRATIVVEPPILPLPGVPYDPRRAALSAVLDELTRLGVPPEQHTILVAGGLGRRAGHRELEGLLSPERARAFHGAVAVHDCESDELVPLSGGGETPLAVDPRLVQTDVVVTVSAAESVLHGGAGVLLGACGAATVAEATADSLLETAASPGWQLAVTLERTLGRRVPVIGASLALNHPRMTGPFRAYPFDSKSWSAVVRSPFRKLLGLLPSPVRRSWLQGIPRELTVVATFGGPPSVAHAEALIRGVELRGTRLPRPLDAIVIPVPWTGGLTRERLNPVTVAQLALGHALRLWRDGFPVVEGGTAVLLHRFTRDFSHSVGRPYRMFFAAARDGLDPAVLASAERQAARDAKAIADYRSGAACHPTLPYRDWASCAPALRRLGAVVVAGCRDHQAARTLGFVPTHGASAALTMAYGRAGSDPRVGFLMAPPYPPLLVEET